MEEKKLTPEEIEALKAVKALKVYCTDRDCNRCMFVRDGFLSDCFFEGFCPEFLAIEELPEDPGQ